MWPLKVETAEEPRTTMRLNLSIVGAIMKTQMSSIRQQLLHSYSKSKEKSREEAKKQVCHEQTPSSPQPCRLKHSSRLLRVAVAS